MRETYRNTVEEQVVRAKLSGCSVIISEDSNPKLGPSWIKNDPHSISENGKLLAKTIERQGLVIINNACTGGPITRKRILKGKVEESCIDFILTSEDISKSLTDAFIDKEQLYTLTKFSTTKGIPSIKRADHYTIIANF